MHPQLHLLSLGESVLKVSDERDILGLTFDCKMTFVKRLC